MGKAFDSTIWPPTPISPKVKALLDRFYELIDLPDPEGSGKRLAEEVFTKDGTLVTHNGVFKGEEELSRSRILAWKTAAKRTHTFDKVFASGNDANDLILFGRMALETTEGENYNSEFAVRGLIEDDGSGNPRVSYWHPYAGHVHAT